MEHATQKNFDGLVKEGKVLVDFYADWCGPCRMLAPILEQIEKENLVPGLKIVKVNVDEEPELAEKYSVMNIPTLYLFKNGSVVGKQIGLMPKPQLVQWLKSVE